MTAPTDSYTLVEPIYETLYIIYLLYVIYYMPYFKEPPKEQLLHEIYRCESSAIIPPYNLDKCTHTCVYLYIYIHYPKPCSIYGRSLLQEFQNAVHRRRSVGA